VTTLNAIELKVFIPAKDFALCKQFYQDIGFVLASDTDGVAYFHHANVGFLLQNFYVKELAENLMMHLLVESVDSWWTAIRDAKIAERYAVKVTAVEQRPWRMRDFVFNRTVRSAGSRRTCARSSRSSHPRHARGRSLRC